MRPYHPEIKLIYCECVCIFYIIYHFLILTGLFSNFNHRFLPIIFKGLDVLPKMSLVIKNLQRVVPIRRVPLRGRMNVVRSILGVKDFDVGIICVDNKRIQHINRIYRKKNVPTDVLSFPFHEVKEYVPHM